MYVCVLAASHCEGDHPLEPASRTHCFAAHCNATDVKK